MSQASRTKCTCRSSCSSQNFYASTDRHMEATKKANKDAYERAKQAEQDALATRTALVETSMQAQTDMEATKKA